MFKRRDLQREILLLEREVSKLQGQVNEMKYSHKPYVYGQDEHGDLKRFEVDDVLIMLFDHLGLQIREEGAKLVARENDGD